MGETILLPLASGRRGYRALLALGFLLLIGCSAYAWLTFTRLEQADAWVDRTQSVLQRLDELYAGAATLVLKERGYLLTHDESLRRDYTDLRSRLPATLERLRGLIADNPQQVARLTRLEPALDSMLREMDQALAGAEAGRPVVDEASIDPVSAVIAAMKDGETSRYRERNAMAEHRLFLARLLISAGTAISLAVIIGVFALMQREARRRIALETELRTFNTRLAEEVSERTRDLRQTADTLRRELSHRRDIEEDLLHTRSFLRLVIENLPGMIFIKDARQHQFVLVNRGFEELLGRHRDDIVGKSYHDVFPAEQANDYVQRDRAVLASHKPAVDVSSMQLGKGTRHIQVKRVPIANEHGQTPFVLGFAEDITERTEIEQQLRQAQKMEALGQLTGGIAHDFNNLLLVILGNLELVAAAVEDQAELKPLLQTAIRACDRGAALTGSLLAFARKQPLRPVRVDVEKLLRDTVQMLKRTLGESIEMALVTGRDLWPCEIDPGELQSALLNLVINARDAMPGGGRLTIEASNVELDETYGDRNMDVAPGPYVMIAVSDTGTGIPHDILTRVFEPFFTTKPAGRGSGLGLSMVYGLVKQSKGHVKIYSEVGIGTTVRIYLPRMVARDEVLPVSISRTPTSRGAESVLVVEDDADVRALTIRMVRDLGYRVHEAQTSSGALEIVKTAPVDLLLTDVVLSGTMTCRELAKAARELCPGLKVLFMSGYTETAISRNGQLDPDVELLQKPFRKQDLAAKLRAVLDGVVDAEKLGSAKSPAIRE